MWNHSHYFSNCGYLVWRKLSTTCRPIRLRLKTDARSHLHNSNDQPTIRGRTIVSTVTSGLRSTSYALVKVDFFWDLLIHTKLSIHHQNYVATRNFLGPFSTSTTCTTGNPSWRRRLPSLHVRQIRGCQIINGFQMWSIKLVILSFKHELIT